MIPTEKAYYTREGYEAFDPAIDEPPRNQDIWCISKFGVGRRGQWNPSTDIAWAPLPRIPQSVKNRM